MPSVTGTIVESKGPLYVHRKSCFLFFKAVGLVYQEDAKKHLSALETRCFNSDMSKEEDIAQIKAKLGFATGGVCQIKLNIGQISSRNVW